MTLQDRESANQSDSQHPMVSSADFARKFGQLRQMQDDQVIFVTHHGRATHVLTTVRHYTALKEANGADRAETIATTSLHELANCLSIGVLLIDYDLRITIAELRGTYGNEGAIVLLTRQ